jgi:hypothetical protein
MSEQIQDAVAAGVEEALRRLHMTGSQRYGRNWDAAAEIATRRGFLRDPRQDGFTRELLGLDPAVIVALAMDDALIEHLGSMTEPQALEWVKANQQKIAESISLNALSVDGYLEEKKRLKETPEEGSMDAYIRERNKRKGR